MGKIITNTETGMPELATDIAERAANRVDDAIVGTKRVAAQAADSVQAGLDTLRDTVPSAMSRYAAQAEDITRRGIERARRTAGGVRERAVHAGDATVSYIRDEPVKAVVAAMAAGAATALVLTWLSRPRNRYDR